MICPSCQAHIPDTALRCPACRADVEHTRMMTRLSVRFCSTCGATLERDAHVCSHCNTPCEVAFQPRIPAAAASHAPQAAPACSASSDVQDASSTSSDAKFMDNARDTVHRCASAPAAPARSPHPSSQIVSAIPSAPAANDITSPHDRFPRMRMLIWALVCAVIFVTSTVLAITHPWNPYAYDIKARVGQDMSQAGSPGVIKELSSQDKSNATDGDVKADDQSYDQLKSAYEKLGKQQVALNDLESTFRNAVANQQSDSYSDIASRVRAASIAVSNIIASVQHVHVETHTYEDEKSRLTTLGNWLRNYCDTLSKLCDYAAKQPRARDLKARVDAKLGTDDSTNNQDTYKNLFETHYDEYKPVYKEPKK